MDWLLLIPYVTLQFFIFLLMAGMGALVLRAALRSSAPFASPGLNFCGAFVAGLAGWSALAAWAGLCGMLRPWVVVAGVCVSAAGLFGLRAELAAAWRRFCPRACWRGAAPPARALLVYAAFMAAWIVVGSAAYDMCQDSMWYHLAVPRAWTQRGTIEAFPLVMPSNYPLALEAVYACILEFFDAPACSMFYGQIQIMAAVSWVVLAASLAGPAAAWPAAALTLLLWAAGAVLVPIPAVNDAAAMLAMTWGLCLLAAPEKLLKPGAAPARGWFMAGIFLGLAASVKLIAAGFSLPFAALCAALTLACNSRAWRAPLLGAAGWLTPMAPWLLRNWIQGCGNPLFPFARNFFPVKPAFAAMNAESLRLNALFPLNAAGLRMALHDIPVKWSYFMNGPDMFFLFFVFAALGGLAAGRGWVRRLAFAMALQGAVLLWVGGANEVVRYFALCYGAAIPVGAGLHALAQAAPARTRRLASGGLAAALVLAAVLGWRRQLTVLEFPAVQWPWRPVLSAASRIQYAKNKETGGVLGVPLAAHGATLPRDARVVLADCRQPFYLDRYYFWADEVSPPFAQAEWAGLDADGLLGWLRARGVTEVVYVRPGGEPRVAELAARGALVDSRFSAGGDWPELRVYSVNLRNP